MPCELTSAAPALPAAPPLAVKLFDHETDPHETSNIAAKHPGLVQQLTEQTNAGWENAL